ncbi:Non-structural maintenance of chromosome element 4 [Erysiphe neolycopersici]|uniref:Non-structural maintenance of chromosomes element 4 n=1 Tax=Erysiphe neolycopersici TaxID=212602 RepID=A0A420HDB6_9PEZI|nr:Non-structural maintenance of chromosome element 4 [Erysiphe neolycopersici]
MARATRIVQSPDSNSDEPQTTYTPQPSKRQESRVQVNTSIPSPVSSISSDQAPPTSEIEDAGERIPMSTQGSFLVSESHRHKRPAEHIIAENPRQRRRTVEPDGDDSDENYDPDQDLEERRIIRKGLRDLNKNLLENRSEFMSPNSSGLEDTITRANNLSRQVKQTSDATIDSHLLVTAADLTYKRTVAIVSGETGQGIDLDDLINRCKVFMRQGDEERTRINISRNERISRNRNEEGDEDIEDEILNWGYLGRNACAQSISRPCLPGFLLGPLSTEKKAKRTVVRKAALKISSLKESRPELLLEKDIIRDEDLNLSTMCQRITTQLEKVRGEAIAAAESETSDEMTDLEVEVLLDKYNLSREGGISLFNFVINPHSFGQSVENLFYVSFLIRDGKMAVSLDSRGIPYLELRDDGEDSSQLDGPTKRHQAVLALDMASWKQLIEAFKINETIIPHREETEVQNLGAKGWYA